MSTTLAALELRPLLPNPGDEEGPQVMILEEFLQNVRAGAYIDYDGYGEYANAGAGWASFISNMKVFPSEVTRESYAPPFWATHVVWYNR